MAQPTRLLMSRPLSVLTRPDQSLQIGLDCDDAVLLGDAPEGADAAVRAFRSPHSAADVSRLLPELATGWLSAAVETLTRRGVLAEAPRARRACRVLGEGPLATEVLRLLRMEGVPLLEPDASPLDAERAGLVLVCHEAAEPDRALTRTLTLAGVPHLVIRTEPERAVVGPFVIPGAGPCVGCTDLVRRDLDPAFPHLLAQLCRATHIPLPRQAAWAAGLACSQVAAWCAGQRLQSLGATLELDAHTGAVGTRLWPRHPDCPCALVHG